MLTSEPALFSINIKPLCSESNDFPNLSWWHWMEVSCQGCSQPPAIFCSCHVLPYSIISKLHTAMLETPISAPTNLCTLLSSRQPTWLDILIVGGIPSQPQSRTQGVQGHFCKGYSPSSAQHNMEVQQSTTVFYPFCLKFTFSIGGDRTGASLRTEAELLTATLAAPASQQVWEAVTFPTLPRQVTWFVMAAAALWSHCTSQGKGMSFPASHSLRIASWILGSILHTLLSSAVQMIQGTSPGQGHCVQLVWCQQWVTLGCRSQALLCAALHEAVFPHHTIPSGATAGNLAPKTASGCPTTCSAHCSWVTIHL